MGLSFLFWWNLPNSQVVGWPPLRSYRVNSCNSHAKSSEVFNSVGEKSKSNNTVVRTDNGNDNNINAKEKRHHSSSLFVKVNMDGIPIGRKVDLSAHSSYETLAQTLEDMFNESTTVITCKGKFSLVLVLIIKKMPLLQGVLICFQDHLDFICMVNILFLCVCFKYSLIAT